MNIQKYLNEFKAFAFKGNIVDLAIAVIIGGAFGKIISSFVGDVVMPLVGLILGGVDFTSLKWVLKPEVLDAEGVVINQAVTMNIGIFLQNIFDFLVIALAIFLMVRIILKAKERMIKAEKAEEAAIEPTADQKLLAEIRDILKNRP